MAETALAAPEAPASGADRHLVVVHVDAATLAENGEGGRSHIEDGPHVSAETSRRLACDASVVRMVDGPDGTPLDVGRKTRSIPPALRRALKERDQGCRFPGCARTRFIDAHHLVHWADGGETSLANTVLACRAHHRLLHEGGWKAERHKDGSFSFQSPRGRGIPNAAQLPVSHDAVRVLAQVANQAGLRIDARTCASHWQGDDPDYDWLVEALLRSKESAARSCP
jgi:hypothetical protein